VDEASTVDVLRILTGKKTRVPRRVRLGTLPRRPFVFIFLPLRTQEQGQRMYVLYAAIL